MRNQVLQQVTPVRYPLDFLSTWRFPKTFSSMIFRRASWSTFMVSLLTLLTSCVSIPLNSNTAVNDNLQSLETLQTGDVLIIYGENAPRPEETFTDYFSAFCLQAYGRRDAIDYLISAILKVNPLPGKFAVKHLDDVKEGLATTIMDERDCVEGTVLCNLGLSKAKVLSDSLRYSIHVSEKFEPELHLPLYAAPFGIASCSHKTILDVEVWELKTDKYIGSFTVSAEGEMTAVAYLFHLYLERDTQRDAIILLAQQIIERFTGLKPLDLD